ncbi:DUF4783 domain-containing protein [Chitinophagaceae bacterium LB-8]|uniref:DUF4783 domain-containing protein n=1 Tax=Paraflavisolibacter caeni TaxID=2982496 RepID=A0A9X2XU55_9BACT|nr:DUF4783 domain-containing protein [Paraflavisolibacter caeni]MCU7548532.1 DUF4783 domain-containing protein [Paraflavisolibacter caeni]
MQKLFALTTISFLFLLTAFTPIRGIDEVVNALRKGDATEISKYIDDNVEISLPGKSDTYSKAQAVMILKDFFSNNGVTGFELKHKGENNGNQYCIGTLLTQSGNYRTTVYMKTINGRQLVRELRFQ